jgi:endonuclease I
MRKLFTIILYILPAMAAAQPAGYYTAAAASTGEALRTALRNIIRPHTELTYTPGLWNAYYTTDVKPNGKLWDVYSDRPAGSPAYEYSMGTSQCGSVTPATEGNCYNREHTWPQSKFASTAPMQTDLYLVYPTDYFVNGSRGDLPYGRVSSATQTFTNGCKIGANAYPGAPGGSCYEPIDSFKGDLARTYFYIATCYKNDSAVFTTWEIATRTRLKPWAAQMLLEWHHLDPVSQKEINRNNAVYALQGNRNPFIDRPQFADCIWGANDCTFLATPEVVAAPASYHLYPNPATQTVTIAPEGISATSDLTVHVRDISGRTVYSGTQRTISVNSWSAGIYFVQLITADGAEVRRLVVE